VSQRILVASEQLADHGGLVAGLQMIRFKRQDAAVGGKSLFKTRFEGLRVLLIQPG
jgi:hypothetical protein